ncbi:ATP phosphoribosyltransferase regulatory subunit [Desulfolucanica intricata]|uniref:ATP phosphoribosyltransferase regulatory subunit n=1 Tax=Desulfolucanica intricata TaxID=1285191 RepID=UPI0008351BC1|nr:ATP phosphoribosyltransferase regulatory subunit [Desulfolucanica intricata]
MSLKNHFGRVPPGVRDLLPGEARAKREIEEKFVALVRAWGYQEVNTPVYEYYENLLSRDSFQEDKMFKFLDRSGHVLALRPDMTRPIARLAATRLKEVPLPMRLFYTGHTFSYEEPQVGRQRESYQAGIEILGESSADADAETVVLATKALLNAGIRDFQVSLGHVGIFHGLMEDLGLSETQVEELKKAIGNKDFVKLRELLSNFKIPRENQNKVLKALNLRGGAEVLKEARELTESDKARRALKNMEEIFSVLQAYQVERYVTVDLGLLRELDYYTGLVFEGYSAALGFPLCGGGRYDKLVGKFGRELPATGFALGVEKVMLVLEREGVLGEEPSPDYLIMYSPEKRAEAAQKAGRLRAEGYTVVARVITSPVEVEIVGKETGAKQKNVIK